MTYIMRLFLPVLTASVLFCSSAAARAEFNIASRVAVREEYNDNIYLSHTNEEDDFITTINPALNMNFRTEKLTFSLDYGLNFRFYQRNPERNETGLGETQRARFDSTASLYRKILYLKIMDEYTRVPVDPRNAVAFDNIFVNMTDSNRLVISPYVDYPLSGRLNLRADYSYQNLWYREEGNDSENHSGSVALSKAFTQAFTATASYRYVAHRPDSTPEYDSHTAGIGASYLVSRRLSLAGNLGKVWFDHADGDYSSSETGDAMATYLITNAITLRATYSKTFSESVTSGTYRTETTTGAVNYNGKIKSSISAFRNISRYIDIDREDRSHGVNIGLNFPLSERASVGMAGNYTTHEFLPEGEESDRYSARASFGYGLRRTSFDLGYTYNLNHSTVNSNDYINNIAWIQARINF